MRVRVAAVGIIGFAAIGAFLAGIHTQPAHAQEAAAAGSKSVWDGVYTQAQADRGKATYTQQCLECHGEELAGQDMTPALAGSDFLSDWNGLTLGDLSERIRTTMPLNHPGTLSRDMIADILAYLLSYNKFPAGQVELPKDTQMLKMITIQATKPDAK
jgi:S-disulfanyl-L-cysteine oxidoreductase SoxD